ncbi:hypothetical protein ACFVUS_30845 [Nocardia sp. NPDC058058]|uniref:TY-Chap domain-containing protein n=1 Tax=Nocardia sp. NPDC058058 TaxID=3346317 RepID=UPI0036DBB19A
MTNAYYHMQLSIRLSAELTRNEIDELRWHLGLGPRLHGPLQVTDGVNLFEQGPGFRRDDPDLAVELSPHEDGGWLLTAWQEPDASEIEQLWPLFCWLAEKADSSTADADGSICLGRMRFADESEWKNRITVYRGCIEYPRLHGRPARELVPDGNAAVTNWESFADRLVVTLPRLRESEWMVVSTASGNGAQFCTDGDDELLCEILAGDILDNGQPLSDQHKAELTRLGWRMPSKSYWGYDNANWEMLMDPHATEAQIREVAQATVSALRDVLGIAAPQHLSLKAQSNYRREEPDTSAMGLRIAPSSLD